MRFGLFERLEQTIRRSILHFVDILDDDEAPLRFIGRKRKTLLQIADDLDFNGRRRFVDFNHIRMDAFGNARTVAASQTTRQMAGTALLA